MRKLYLPILAFVIFQFSFSQVKAEDPFSPPPSTNIETTVITINLSRPKPNSVSHSGGKKKLVVKNRNPLSISLVNGNPFRYTYVINYETINLFGTADFDIKPLDSIEISGEKSGFIENTLLLAETIESKQQKLQIDINYFKASVEIYLASLYGMDDFDYDKFKINRSNIYDKLQSLKGRNNENIISIAELDSVSDEINSLQSENDISIIDINKSISPLLKVVSNAFLLPIDINGNNIDYVEIRLQRIDNTNSTTETYIYKVWINGGLKIDVSGGAYITSLFDYQYTTTSVFNEDGTASNLSTITENNLGKYDFGFGAMVNISLRGGSWVRPTLNFGTLLTSNQKFQILTGFGLILGKNERWIIHGGIAMGQVSVIQDSFIADGAASYNLGSTQKVPVVNQFKFGHFFGVSYNFSKPKSNND